MYSLQKEVKKNLRKHDLDLLQSTQIRQSKQHHEKKRFLQESADIDSKDKSKKRKETKEEVFFQEGIIIILCIQ